MLPQFPTVHCHPYSLDSASTPADFAKREVELGSGTLTVTDHGSLGACKEVYDLAQKNGLVACIGLEAYLRDDDCSILLRKGVPRNREMVCGQCQEKWKGDAPKCQCGRSCGVERWTFRETWNKYHHVTLGFRSYAAYLCAVRLLTKADLNAERHGQERKPLFTWADLEELASHDTTATSSCLIGAVSRHLVGHDDPNVAIAYYEKLRSMFGPQKWFVEVFPHKTDTNWVQGVVLKGEDGRQVKYHYGKKLRTNVGEIEAASLAQEWGKKSCEHCEILAVSNYRVWDETDRMKLQNVQSIEGFVPNECRPWTPDGDLQAGCNRFVLALAEKYGDKVVIGDDSHFAHPEEKVVQDVRLGQSGSWRFSSSYHRMSSDEAYSHFQETLGTSVGEFLGWVGNSIDWASSFRGFKFPSEPMLPVKHYPGDSTVRVFELIQKNGRMPWGDKKYEDRLAYELDLFSNNGKVDLLPYFFPIEEMCSYYASQGWLTGPGRGSAAGVLMSYLIGITHADPIRYELSIDRFITMDRIRDGAYPDIDQDFPFREPLVKKGGWLDQRFGECYAQVSADTKLKLRSSVKDVHRALYGRVAPEVEELTKQFVQPAQGVDDKDHVNGYANSGAWVSGAKETDAALMLYIERYPNEWELVQKCLGLYRNKTRHASAYLIMSDPVGNFIPLTEVGGERVTAYTAKSVEAVGGIKYDILVVNSLADIGDALKLVQSRHTAPIPEELHVHDRLVPRHRLVPFRDTFRDIWDLPDDLGVYRDIAAGRTETVFQFSTSGARKWMKYFDYRRPDGSPAIRSVLDLAAFTALDRPGPLDILLTNPETGDKHNALVEYSRRVRGLSGSRDVSPVMSHLVPATYGILVYQESLQYAYQQLTGVSGSDAEKFRRAVAKKDMKKVIDKYEFFLERAADKVGGRPQAQAIWDSFATWANYGFNMSHSVCYSLIGYATAYLKHHYPLEWWTSVLRNAKKEEIAEEFWQHCSPFVLMPDVAKSGESFQIEDDRIRAPLWLVDGVGPGAHDELVAGKPYRDIRDFCDRIQSRRLAKAKVRPATVDAKGKARSEGIMLGTSPLHRGVVSKLILTGVLDSLFPLGTNLYEKFGMYEAALAESQSVATGKKVRPDSVDTRFLSLDAIGRYQLTKSVLPVYSGPLLAYFPDSLTMRAYGGKTCLRRSGDPAEFVDRRQLEALETGPMDGPIVVAVAAYIQDARRFVYRNNEKCAWELSIDMEGGRRSTVYWGSKRDGGELQPGCVAALVMMRSKEERGFSVVDWAMVRGPLVLEDVEEVVEPRVYGLGKEPPAGAVDITRAGPWGNPYSHLATGTTAPFRTKTVEQAVRAYEAWLPTQPQLVERLRDLVGRSLTCACPPKKGWRESDLGGYRCHGQVLLRAVQGMKR